MSHVDIKSSWLVESWQSLAESVHHGGWVLRGLVYRQHVGRSSRVCKQMRWQCHRHCANKIEKEGNTCIHITRHTVASEEDRTGTSVNCILPCSFSFFSSTQPTSRALRTDGRCSSSYLWCHVCCLRMFSVHVQKRPCPPPFIPRLGLFLGLWHLQCQPKCRLPEQLASPLQWSNPRGVGKRLHKGSSRELPLGTAITLEKWFFRNLNITFPLAFFWCLELSSHSLLFTWYGIVQSFRKLLCFALL